MNHHRQAHATNPEDHEHIHEVPLHNPLLQPLPDDIEPDSAIPIRKGKMAKKFEEILRARQYTPDMRELERCKHHLLFLYDDFRSGKELNHSLNTTYQESFLIGSAITEDEEYELYYNNDCSVIMSGNDDSKYGPLIKPRGPINGELWLVDTQTIISLDYCYCNGVAWKRATDLVWLTEESRLPEYLDLDSDEFLAWRYEGVPSFWRKKIENEHVVKGNLVCDTTSTLRMTTAP